MAGEGGGKRVGVEPQLVAQRYRLDERVGSGGMGVVWRGHDMLLNRTVAVKQLVLGPALSPAEAAECRERAMREGRIAARLQHPHAINVFDVALGPDAEGDEEDQPWLVMEYLPSRSLADVLAEQGALPPLKVARIGRHIADALAAAHRAGIVHRDVKPGNVLLGDNGTVKITDFGISRASWDVTVTRDGILTGTPAYFAPEVARGESPGPASDVYSLGATLYTAVEGEPPFGRDGNTLALLRSIAEGEVRPPERAGPLSGLLMQLLRQDPAARPLMGIARDMLGRIAATDRETTTASLPAARDDSPPPTGIAAPASISAPTGQSAAEESRPPEDAPPAEAPETPSSVPAAASAQAVAQQDAPSADDADTALPSAAADVQVARSPDPMPPVSAPPAKPSEDRDLPGAPGSSPGRPGRWRRGRVIAAAAVLLLVAVGALILAIALNGPEDRSTAASTQSSEASAAPTTTTPAPTQASATTTTQATTTTPAPAAPAAPGPADFEQAVRTYYGLLPNQLDEAYAYLGPDVQNQAGGRSGYENFWNDYSEVEADNVQAEGTTVTLTIIYTRPDGSTFTEPYVLEMGTAEDGRILILHSEYGGPG